MIQRDLQTLSRGVERMRPPPEATFELYLDDDRYAVPTLKLIEAGDEVEALSVARRLLHESPHHRGAELCRDGRRLAGLGTYATRIMPRDDRMADEAD